MPLSSLRVLDLAGPAGVYCTRLLADLGADVIKVEPPGGDPMRRTGPFYHHEPHPERSLYFFHFNANKRSVTLDLETAEGRDRFRELARTADVVVETFQPGYLDRLGLGYQDLKQLNPGIVLTSITGFGQTGPWRDYKSCDLVALATAGLLYICGWPDLPPQRIAGSQADYMASVQAAAGTLLAVFHRLNTGKGQHVDVSMQQSVPVCLQNATLVYERTGRFRQRTGNGQPYPGVPGQGVFPCKDGYVDIAQLGGLVWWDRIVAWLDSEGAAGELKEARWKDPFYRTRPEAIEDGNRVISTFLAKHTKADIFNRAQQKGVVVGPVNNPEDIVNDPHFTRRPFFVPVAHPELGTSLRYVGAPYRLSATPWRIARRSPLIGEHNAELLGDQRGERPPVAIPLVRLADSRNGAGVAGAGGKKRLPLEGIRVIEFTEQVAAPMVGKALADFGAQVILVENEERARTGASSRHPNVGAPNPSSLNQGQHFNKFNTNKLSVTLNLTRPRAMETARKLIARSDVVISNFVPRVLERWGLTYPELKKIRPDIILLTMPAFGADSPYRDYRTLSWNLMAMCGLDQASGFPGRSPIRASPYSHPDTSSQPFHGLVATLAALYWRALTGKGQHIEVCQYESTLCFTGTLLFNYLVNSEIPTPKGNRVDHASPHGVYRCRGKDRWCAIAVFSEEEWWSFCRVMRREDLAIDERFISLRDRLRNADALDEIINGWTGTREDWEVMQVLQKGGIAAGVVETVADLQHHDPQLKARGHWVKIDHPEVGPATNEDWGFRLSGVPPLEWRHAPLIGEHNDVVLNRILGLTEAEINQLIIEGVVG